MGGGEEGREENGRFDECSTDMEAKANDCAGVCHGPVASGANRVRV